MADIAALKKMRKDRFFESWDESVAKEHVTTSEASVGHLLDDLIALGDTPAERSVRRAVDLCIRRFNDLNDGWICTIEREFICDVVGDIVEAYGYECAEDWFDERDW
jgi:hypothetical protein